MPENTILAEDAVINIPDGEVPLTMYLESGDKREIGRARMDANGNVTLWLNDDVDPEVNHALVTNSGTPTYSVGFDEVGVSLDEIREPAIRYVKHDLDGDIPPAPDLTKWLREGIRMPELGKENIAPSQTNDTPEYRALLEQIEEFKKSIEPELLYDPNCNCPWNNGYQLVIPGHHIQCTALKQPHHVDDLCDPMRGHLDGSQGAPPSPYVRKKPR